MRSRPGHQKDVAEAWNVGLYKGGGYENYRMPADRSLLGQVASRLVALAFGGDYDAYTGYRGLQRQIKDQPWGSTVAEELGLLQGREDGDIGLRRRHYPAGGRCGFGAGLSAVLR